MRIILLDKVWVVQIPFVRLVKLQFQVDHLAHPVVPNYYYYYHYYYLNGFLSINVILFKYFDQVFFLSLKSILQFCPDQKNSVISEIV